MIEKIKYIGEKITEIIQVLISVVLSLMMCLILLLYSDYIWVLMFIVFISAFNYVIVREMIKYLKRKIP